MAHEERERSRVGRKLTKKRRDSRRVSLDIPERFKDGEDAHEDVTAPKRNNTVSMNQSIFSMIARAGQQSQADLGAMQEVDSGDSDEEGKPKVQYHSLDGAARLSRLSSANDFQAQADNVKDGTAPQTKHRRAISDNKLLRSLRISSKKDVKSENQPSDQMSSSQFLPPRPSEPASPAISHGETSLKYKSKVAPGQELRVEKRRTSDRKSRQGSSAGIPKSKASVTLATRLQQIFDFDDLEEVISGMLLYWFPEHELTHVEYPCWLLQSILLQGYMYITQKHICFYAYIPKKHVSFPPDTELL
jgi:sterol 3beta-glucosyltransferase